MPCQRKMSGILEYAINRELLIWCASDVVPIMCIQNLVKFCPLFSRYCAKNNF